MPSTSDPIRGPAPSPAGPIACTLSPNDLAGRLQEFRGLFAHLRAMERPEPARLSLILDRAVDPEAVRELLVREQACCAFLGFTITPEADRLVADLEVPAEAAPTLDGFAELARLAAPGAAR
jgi:hypothetical protein